MGNTVSLSDICGNFRTPFSLTDLTEPYQPRNIEFPPTISKVAKKRHFQASWFDKYQWFHYDCHLDAAFCFICIKANEKKALSASKTRMVSQKKVSETGKSTYRCFSLPRNITGAPGSNNENCRSTFSYLWENRCKYV